MRRIADILVSGTTLLLTSPILIVVAIAIRLDSRGPAIFRQRRIGRGEREFTLLKFRSMRVDANPKLHRDYVTALIHHGSGNGSNGTARQRHRLGERTRHGTARAASTSSQSMTGSPRSAASSASGALTSCRSSSTSSPAT